ncbi:polysaccharide deacetylase family protein [Fredinandcohnia sp. 179-A 10B2 NHS]|uniref:polysaccharide deacetylase family protein n=1 Tax=Fredinandcohnia sp. 179-A 10B2 NHS TaxID=3235176 RepID=UPI0039A0AA14
MTILRKIVILGISTMLIATACDSKNKEVAGDMPQDKHELGQKDDAQPESRFPIDTSWKSDYLIDIKGESPYLSDGVRESMEQWRGEIVEFSKLNESVFINGKNEKKVALTFDDGPDDTVTSAVIGILDKYKVKGNFFFLGSEAEKQPEVVKEAFEKGHLVLSHSYNHVELTKLGKDEVNTEFKQAADVIESIIGQEPALMRPPYGSTNELVVEVAKDQGTNIVIWSIDSLDWAQRSTDVILSNSLDNIRNGDIILMHTDSDEYDTYEALPELIESLQDKGFEIVGLEELLGVPAYK